MTVADLAQPGEIGGRRHDDAAGTHDRLGDHRRNSVRAFGEDRLLDRVGGANARLLVAAPAIRIRGCYLDEAGHQRPEHLLIGRHPGGAHRRKSHAVIGVDARNDLGLFRLVFDLPIIAREFESRFVRFRARSGEIDCGRIRIAVSDDFLGEADRRLVGGADISRGESDPPHLHAGRVGQLAAAVPGIDIPQTREPDDIFATIGVVQRGSATLDDDKRLAMVVRMVQWMDEETPIGFEQLGGALHLFPPSARSLAGTLTAAVGWKQRRPRSTAKQLSPP